MHALSDIAHSEYAVTPGYSVLWRNKVLVKGFSKINSDYDGEIIDIIYIKEAYEIKSVFVG